MRLQGKVIIVTGSTTGIGKAIAIRCVAEGALVVLHGLEQSLGEEVLAQIGKDKASLLIEDITTDGAPQRLVDRTAPVLSGRAALRSRLRIAGNRKGTYSMYPDTSASAFSVRPV